MLNLLVIVAAVAMAVVAAAVAVALGAFAHSLDLHCGFRGAKDVHHRRPIAVNYTRLANRDFLVDHANSNMNEQK